MPAALLDALPPPSSPLTPVPLSAQAVSRVAVIRVSAVFFHGFFLLGVGKRVGLC